jgi:hypothetical protein
MSYPGIIKEAALGKLFHTDLSLRHIADELGKRIQNGYPVYRQLPCPFVFNAMHYLVVFSA